MYCLCSFARSFGFIACTAYPWNSNSPLQALSCIPRIWSNVDLPAPDGPMMERNSPSLTSMSICRRTNVLLTPCEYDFSKLRSAIMVPHSIDGACDRPTCSREALSDRGTSERLGITDYSSWVCCTKRLASSHHSAQRRSVHGKTPHGNPQPTASPDYSAVAIRHRGRTPLSPGWDAGVDETAGTPVPRWYDPCRFHIDQESTPVRSRSPGIICHSC